MNTLLLNTLKPLEPYYSNLDIEEIAVNRSGEIWCKYRSSSSQKGWISEENPHLTAGYISGLCQKLANIHQLPFLSQGIPILSTTIPGGHRLQAIVGSNVRYYHDDIEGVACSIRLFNKEKRVTLADFGLTYDQPLFHPQHTHKTYYDHNPLQDLLTCIEQGESILISGATSTGKTSFLNDLLEYIPRSLRIITVEDTRELLVPHPNRVHLLAARTDALNKVGYSEILDVVVRLTPDILIAGEVSMKNAMGIYRLMTTGHANFMATIHASSPEEAVKAFYQNLAYHHPGMDYQTVSTILAASIGRIVQINRCNGIRMVTAIDIPGMVRDTAVQLEKGYRQYAVS